MKIKFPIRQYSMKGEELLFGNNASMPLLVVGFDKGYTKVKYKVQYDLFLIAIGKPEWEAVPAIAEPLGQPYLVRHEDSQKVEENVIKIIRRDIGVKLPSSNLLESKVVQRGAPYELNPLGAAATLAFLNCVTPELKLDKEERSVAYLPGKETIKKLRYGGKEILTPVQFYMIEPK